MKTKPGNSTVTISNDWNIKKGTTVFVDNEKMLVKRIIKGNPYDSAEVTQATWLRLLPGRVQWFFRRTLRKIRWCWWNLLDSIEERESEHSS